MTTSFYKLIKEERVDEISSIAFQYEHESGASILFLSNDDDNKVFSIAFKTPPKDHTGVPHIIEHAVLAGSRKFRTKEPFVDLMKGSLNTFLNAMTYPDKTVYPIGSRNLKDFYNLMDVYLDAVFYPQIHESDDTFMQEGWHYELTEEGLETRGVVYNEMKGAYSSPMRILEGEAFKRLYNNSCYHFESGGHPEHITELTYEGFKEFHKSYYTPSNAYIVVYGDLDKEECLKFIHDEYLSRITDLGQKVKIARADKSLAVKEDVCHYPIGKDESLDGKAYLSVSYVAGDLLDQKLTLSLEVLNHMLLESQGAPLKKALVDADIGMDIVGHIDTSIIEPFINITAQNAKASDKDRFVDLINQTLADLVNNGLDKSLIESSINLKEFKLREGDYGGAPKGLLSALKAYETFIHDIDPLIPLKYTDIFAELREKGLKGRYFEELIERYLINNSRKLVLTLMPDQNLADNIAMAKKEELAKIYKELNDDDKTYMQDKKEKLILKQTSPDSIEAQNTIPLLEIKDIDKEIKPLPIVEIDGDGYKILEHPMDTSSIAYSNYYFRVGMEEIEYASLLSYLLKKLNTKDYSYVDLNNQINIYVGELSFSFEVYNKVIDDFEAIPLLRLKTRSFSTNFAKANDFALSIIRDTLFDDKQRIKQLISQVKSQLETKFEERGHTMAGTRLSSYYSGGGVLLDRSSGIAYFKFIKNLLDNYDGLYESLVGNLCKVYKETFTRQRLVASIGVDKGLIGELRQIMESSLQKLPLGSLDKSADNFSITKQREGFKLESRVNYVTMGYSYKALGYKYDGTMEVLKTFLNTDYLWNEVRVKGGAYGCFCTIDLTGNFSFASYRDPNLKNTLDVYRNAPMAISKLDLEERELRKLIIGTISRLDQPLTPFMKVSQSDMYYFRGISDEMLSKERREVLDCGLESIRAKAKLVSDVVSENLICVVGNSKDIEASTEEFDTIERAK